MINTDTQLQFGTIFWYPSANSSKLGTPKIGRFISNIYCTKTRGFRGLNLWPTPNCSAVPWLWVLRQFFLNLGSKYITVDILNVFDQSEQCDLFKSIFCMWIKDGFQFGKFRLTTTWQHENLDHSNLNPNLESKQTPDNMLTPSSLDNFRAQRHRSTQAWFDDEQCRGCAGVVWTCEVAVAESANTNLPPIQIGFVHAIFQLLVCYIYCNIIQHLQDNFLGTTFESVGSISMWLYCSWWAKCIRR